MNNHQKLLTEIYEDLKEEIYGSELIVDVGNVKKRKDELLSLDEYLPNLLRPYLGMDYSSKLMDSPNHDDIVKQMADTRQFNNEDNMVEYINWIDTHKEFKDCLIEEKVIIIADMIETVEKDYKEYFKKLNGKKRDNY